MPTVPQCEACKDSPAHLVRPRDGSRVCRDCFYRLFEDEALETIRSDGHLLRGDRVAVGASGGKDSTVLIHVLDRLNTRFSLGLDLVLLSIDEGIKGYRDDSLETVGRNRDVYGLPLTVVSYKELYGWTMDEIVAAIGPKSNCTFCGVFRRQALDRGALRLGCTKIATGHNADDAAETVLMNMLRGDIGRINRNANGPSSTSDCGGGEPLLGGLPRTKPLRMSYEKEIVLYARFKGLDYFSTECTYSKEAFRGGARGLVKDLERVRPRAILDIIRAGDAFKVDDADGAAVSSRARAKLPTMRACERCGYMASQTLCKACVLLEGLNAGRAKIQVEVEEEKQ